MKSGVVVGIISVALVAPGLSGCLALPFAVAAVGSASALEGFKKGAEQDKARDEDAFSRATAAALNVSPYKVGVSDMHRGFKDKWNAQVDGQSYACTALSSTLHNPSCIRLAAAK